MIQSSPKKPNLYLSKSSQNTSHTLNSPSIAIKQLLLNTSITLSSLATNSTAQESPAMSSCAHNSHSTHPTVYYSPLHQLHEFPPCYTNQDSTQLYCTTSTGYFFISTSSTGLNSPFDLSPSPIHSQNYL